MFLYSKYSVQFSCSVMSNSLWPHELQHARPPCLSPTPGVHPNSCPLSQWCHPTISSCVVPSPPALNLSQHQDLFKRVSSSHQVAKDWSFNISPSNEHPGLLSFSMDWWDRLAGQGTLKSILQHHCSKASILLHLSFFIVQISHAYMTTGKTVALTRWTFLGNSKYIQGHNPIYCIFIYVFSYIYYFKMLYIIRTFLDSGSYYQWDCFSFC